MCFTIDSLVLNSQPRSTAVNAIAWGGPNLLIVFIFVSCILYIYFFSFKIPFGWFWLRFYPDFVSRVLGNFYFFSVCQWPAFLVAIIKDDYKNSNNRLTVKRARCRTMNSLGFVSFQVSLIPYFQRGNWGSELRSNLPRVAELRKSSVGIPT